MKRRKRKILTEITYVEAIRWEIKNIEEYLEKKEVIEG